VLGLCKVEGCKVNTGDKARCPKHEKEHADAEQGRYWLRRYRAVFT
jgi:hypothetical protein